ncbi:hypothetical protein HRbin12_01300 [bacterium HR12]|nr:hypothetical protein HRbin12_01300 [bacterium HR12]
MGTANTVLASFTPRRLARVMKATNPMAISTLCSARAGTAEVTATVPAVTLTATVRT